MSEDKPASPVGNWQGWYENLQEVRSYADSTTYEMAAKFFEDSTLVEDWGCGGGGFRQFCKVPYVGIDGTKNKFVDKVVDLCTYKSSVDSIMMRHILEHNFRWTEILDNALASFQRKMCLILFTPFAEQTTQLHFWNDVQVPDLALPKAEIESRFDKLGLQWQLIDNIPTQSQYKQEHVYLLIKA